MKLQIALLTALSLASAAPLSAGDDDSTTEKLIKYKVYEESDNDSTLKKAAGLKATGEILDDGEDSSLKKATKLKVLKEASE
jgi:hypothetical protein